LRPLAIAFLCFTPINRSDEAEHIGFMSFSLRFVKSVIPKGADMFSTARSPTGTADMAAFYVCNTMK
jgi:hypothetical protein